MSSRIVKRKVLNCQEILEQFYLMQLNAQESKLLKPLLINYFYIHVF